MCGLVLLVNKSKNGFNREQQNVFSTLLYLSGHFRGRDGAGVVVVDNIGNVKLSKEACTVDEFIRTKEYDELEKYAFRSGWAMIGHNRSATRGNISDVNSHPFVVDDKIVLVHNGTFNGNHKEVKDTEVDSEAIAHELAKNATTEESLRKINAAYALIWYNIQKKQLNIIRNFSRPLWYMETNDSYVYASEDSFLHFVKAKYRLNVRRDPFEIKEYNLATYTLDDKNDCQFEAADLDCSYYKHNPTGGHGYSHNPFRGKRWNNTTKTWEEEKETSIIDITANQYMACGYGDWDDNDGFDQTLAAQNLHDRPTPPIVVDRYDGGPSVRDSTGAVIRPAGFVTRDTIIDTRGGLRVEIHKAIKPVIERKLYKDFISLNESYKGTTKLRVDVNDIIEAGGNNQFVLIGKTMDENRLHACIPVKGKTLEQLMQLSEDAIFEVDYSGITWTRDDEDAGMKRNLDMFEGLALVHTINPQPIYLSANEASSAH